MLPQEWRPYSSHCSTLPSPVAELDNKLKWLESEHLVKPQDCSCTRRVLSFPLIHSSCFKSKSAKACKVQKCLSSPSSSIFDTYLKINQELNKHLCSPEPSKARDQSERLPPEQRDLPLIPQMWSLLCPEQRSGPYTCQQQHSRATS